MLAIRHLAEELWLREHCVIRLFRWSGWLRLGSPELVIGSVYQLAIAILCPALAAVAARRSTKLERFSRDLNRVDKKGHAFLIECLPGMEAGRHGAGCSRRTS